MMGTCEYCRGPIGGSKPSFRKYCSVRCENKEQGRQAALKDIRHEIMKDEFQMIVGPYGKPASDTLWILGHDHAIGRFQALLNKKLAASPAPEKKI